MAGTRTKTWLWRLAVLLFLVLLLPALIKVNFLRRGIASALSAQLGRTVRTGDVHPKILGGLGFAIDNVTVDEDPRFGIEPFARIETLRATIALRSLWKGRIEFSSLTLENPRLNVVRNAAGEWNLESWRMLPQAFRRVSESGPGSTAASNRALPRIQIESARINFKSENEKKPYIIGALDMEVLPPTGPGDPWRLRFECSPDRTDLPRRAVTRVQGQAAVGPFSANEPGSPLLLDLTADNAMWEELGSVFTGHDPGFHASVGLRVHLTGTTTRLRISGQADVRDLHRWDLLPPPAASSLHLQLAGLLDLQENRLEDVSISVPMGDGSAVMQGSIGDLLGSVQPDVQLHLRHIPVASLVSMARQLTTRIDPRLAARGFVDGSIGMLGRPDGLHGTLQVTDGVLDAGQTLQPVRVSDFTVEVSAQAADVGPVIASLGSGGAVNFTLRLDRKAGSADLEFRSQNAPAAIFTRWAALLGVPLDRANISSGNLAMNVHANLNPDHVWDVGGWAQLSGAVLTSESVNGPIQVGSARVRFLKDRILVQPLSANLGNVALQGSFSADTSAAALLARNPRSPKPLIEFDWQTPALDLADMDRLIDPRYRSMLLFEFGDDDRVPASIFDSLAAHGSLRIGRLTFRGRSIENFKASLDFKKRLLQIRSFTGDFAGGQQTGSGSVLFDSAAPSFTLESRYSDVELQQVVAAFDLPGGFSGGKISGRISVSGRGASLEEIADHLTGSGDFRGRNLQLRGVTVSPSPASDPEAVLRISTLSSQFHIRDRQVSLDDLTFSASPSPERARQSGEKASEITVNGTIGFGRELNLRMETSEGAPRTFFWRGSLLAPELAEAAPVGPRANTSFARR